MNVKKLLYLAIAVLLCVVVGFETGTVANASGNKTNTNSTKQKPMQAATIKFKKGIKDTLPEIPKTFKEKIKAPKKSPFDNENLTTNESSDDGSIKTLSNYRTEGTDGVFETMYSDNKEIFDVTVYENPPEFVFDPNPKIKIINKVITVLGDKNARFIDNGYSQQLFWTDKETGCLYIFAVIKGKDDRNKKVGIGEFEGIIKSLTKLSE